MYKTGNFGGAEKPTKTVYMFHHSPVSKHAQQKKTVTSKLGWKMNKILVSFPSTSSSSRKAALSKYLICIIIIKISKMVSPRHEMALASKAF